MCLSRLPPKRGDFPEPVILKDKNLYWISNNLWLKAFAKISLKRMMMFRQILLMAYINIYVVAFSVFEVLRKIKIVSVTSSSKKRRLAGTVIWRDKKLYWICNNLWLKAFAKISLKRMMMFRQILLMAYFNIYVVAFSVFEALRKIKIVSVTSSSKERWFSRTSNFKR